MAGASVVRDKGVFTWKGATMKSGMRIALVAAVVALSASSVLAQEQQRQRQGRGFGGMGGGGILFLLGQKSVQEELKLSDEQIKKVQEMSEKQRESMQGLRDLDQEERRTKMQELTQASQKAVAQTLKPEQLKRAKQIALQQPNAITGEEVAKELNITDEQKEKMREIRMQSFEEMRDLGRDEEGAKKRQELTKATNEKMLAVLTAEQKAKLKELQGEPFKGKIERPQFGGRRNQQN